MLNPRIDVIEAMCKLSKEIPNLVFPPIFFEGIAKLLNHSLNNKGENFFSRFIVTILRPLGVSAAVPEILQQLVRRLPEFGVDAEEAARLFENFGPVAPTLENISDLSEQMESDDICISIYATIAFSNWLKPNSSKLGSPLQFAKLLLSKDGNMCKQAVQLNGKLNASPTVPEFLKRLAELLLIEDEIICNWVIKELGRLSQAATIPEFLHWLLELLQGEDEVFFSRAAEVIGELGAAAATPDLLHKIAELLKRKGGNSPSIVRGVISRIGSTAATPEILNELADLLLHGDESVRSEAAEVIGEFGSSAAEPGFLQRLAKLLENKNESVRYWTLKSVGRLGSMAAVPEILSRLADLLLDEDDVVLALHAVGKLGADAATQDILLELTKLLGDEGRGIHKYVVKTVGQLGAAAATPEILQQLAELLAGEKKIRKATIKTIGKMGTAAATPEFLQRLFRHLLDGNEKVRMSVFEVWEKLEPTSPTPELLQFLSELLMDKNKVTEECILLSITILVDTAATPATLQLTARLLDKEDISAYVGEIVDAAGEDAAAPQFLQNLSKLLLNDNMTIRHRAVDMIGRLGSAAATPEILQQLATPEILQHLATQIENKDDNVRCRATKVVGRLGPVAAVPSILQRLPTLLLDEDYTVSNLAIKVVGKLGSAAATPEILQQLATLIEHEYGSVRYRATEVVGRLGPAAAVPDILKRLLKLLLDENDKVRNLAIKVVGKLGSAAETPAILQQLKKRQMNGESIGASAGEIMGEVCKVATVPQYQNQFTTKLAACLQLAPTASVSEWLDHFYFALRMGYAAGNIRCQVIWRTEGSQYVVLGYVDKDYFEFNLTLQQAQLFRRLTPFIIGRFLGEKTYDQTLQSVVEQWPSLDKDPFLEDSRQAPLLEKAGPASLTASPEKSSVAQETSKKTTEHSPTPPQAPTSWEDVFTQLYGSDQFILCFKTPVTISYKAKQVTLAFTERKELTEALLEDFAEALLEQGEQIDKNPLKVNDCAVEYPLLILEMGSSIQAKRLCNLIQEKGGLNLPGKVTATDPVGNAGFWHQQGSESKPPEEKKDTDNEGRTMSTSQF